METEKDLSQEGAGLRQHAWLSSDGWSCYTVAQCGLHSGRTDLNGPEMLNYVIIFWEGSRLRYFGCTGMHPNNRKIISSFIFSYARVCICVYVFM